MVPVGEGSGLMRWAMLSGMLMVSGEMWGWTGLTGDSAALLGSLLSLDRAVNVIFILVLGKRKQHLDQRKKQEKQVSLLPGNKQAEEAQLKPKEEYCEMFKYGHTVHQHHYVTHHV